MCKHITKSLTETSFYHRQSTQTARGAIRLVARETCWHEWPPFRWTTHEWSWQTAQLSDIIWVMCLYYEDGEVGTGSTRDAHACSSVDIWIGLKIDQVTVKLAIHRITSQGQCCISASEYKQHWGSGTKSTTDRWSHSKWYLPQLI